MNHRLSILLGFFSLLPASADIIINEISATQADRNLRWDSNNQPFIGAAPAWWSPNFKDSHWQKGEMPLGFSLGTINTNLGTALRDIAPTFYVRKSFSASDSSSSLQLKIQYNDGFIAWINGVEVARENMGADKAHIYHDQLSYRGSEHSTSTRTINLGLSSELLNEGENIIAIQINNHLIGGNMRLDFSLQNSAAQLVAFGSEVDYLPGLMEPSSDLFEPAILEDPALKNETSDWIELHNTSPDPVSLANWTLTDEAQLPSKWIFPVGTIIPGNGYLVILADNPDSTIAGATYLHANFKLSGSGEFVGLYDSTGTEISAISPGYPRQIPQYSYGHDGSGNLAFFANPTPGAANEGETFEEKVDAPDFDHKGGFYDSTVTVTLTSETPDAIIRYTTDGTEPELTNGLLYSAPLSLATISTKKGHIIRARAFREGFIPSNAKTHTFLVGQDPLLRDSPALIYAGDPERSLYDPFGALAIGGGSYSGNLWQPIGVGDYNQAINRGRPYERPIHAEFYFPDGTVGFRSDVGVRVSASSWSRPRLRLTSTDSSPWVTNATQKPSFNLYFRDDYGNPSVNLPLTPISRGVSDYSQFRIRAGKNDINNPFITDEFVRRLSSDMGNPASNGVINSLYVNGELKGYYNMVERLRAPFLEAIHRTDPGVDWDILAFENGTDNVADGDKDSWYDMISRLEAPINKANWESVLEIADIANMADYYLLNIYMSMWDWPHNNWIAAKERSDRGRYRLYVWDAEGAMNVAGGLSINTNTIQGHLLQNGDQELRVLWRGLNRWEEFQMIFADRIHKHLFNGGVLDDRDIANSRLKFRWDELVGGFTDLLKSVSGQNAVLSTKFNSWTRETNGRRSYLLGPNREDFRNSDLWPTPTPPEFSKLGGSLSLGETLKLTNTSGEIYYTTDGSDPRLFGGTANPVAASQPGSLLDLTLIPLESEWKHNSTGGDLGSAWRSMSFDDSTWLTGAAPLGYGRIDETLQDGSRVRIPIATEINSSFSNRQPVCYFRKNFEIADADTVIALTAGIQADAGTIVYLNGIKVFQDSNIPGEGAYGVEPTSDASDGNEGDIDTHVLDPNLLVDGINVIAVELHNRIGSSDMIFDLQLTTSVTNPNNPPVAINGPTTVKARTLDNGVWSAVTEANFTVNTVPATSTNLAVVEILYNPIGASVNEMNAGFDDGDLFEYLRLQNTGLTTVDLSDVRFVDGISFDFATSNLSVIPPNGAVILVSDLAAFQERYGTIYDHLIAGQYTGQLNNGGELVQIIGKDDTLIHEFNFEIGSPWPDLSMLDGHSIQINEPTGDHDDGSNWRASGNVGGIPDGQVTYALWQQSEFSEGEQNDASISGENADPDGDGWSNLFEFAMGSSPSSARSLPLGISGSIETLADQRFLILSYTRTAGSRGVSFGADLSEDLETWSGNGIPHGEVIFNPDGTTTEKFRHPLPITESDQKQFMRLRVLIE